jgi:hypothetical protein
MVSIPTSTYSLVPSLLLFLDLSKEGRTEVLLLLVAWCFLRTKEEVVGGYALPLLQGAQLKVALV